MANAEAVPEDADTLADELADDAPDPDDLPDHDAEPDAAADEPGPQTPFYTVSGRAAATVSVRAGWLTDGGDVHSLAIDATVGVEQAGAAQSLALSWYTRALSAIYGAAAEDEPSED